MLLAACTPSVPGEEIPATHKPASSASAGDDEEAEVQAEEMPAAPEGLESFYEQEISWGECEDSDSDRVSCATVKVPLNYDEPDGETIEIALKKSAATGDSLGPLLVNPGGPGASGRDVAQDASSYFSANLLQAYDIIGFDPRGVGLSSPIDCLDDQALGALTDTSYPEGKEGELRSEADAKRAIAGCLEKTGDALEFMGTISAAKDMDVIRAALQRPKLDYFGFSYGTHLGAQYADLFPTNVGRMVLDGAIDPALDALESDHFQAVGFENALRSYVQYCIDEGNCPLSGSTVDEALKDLRSAIDDSLENPIPTANEDRPLTQTMFYTGIALPLYDDTSWPYLTEGLRMALKHDDGTLLQYMGDLMISRDTETGEFLDNSLEARWAINCVDYPLDTDEAAWEEADKKLDEDAPTFAPFFKGSQYFCSEWPYHADKVPGPFTATGSNPIIVVGTKGDPATPYDSAVNMAKQLDNGVLVTWDGEGHTAYNRSDCVTAALDDFFIQGIIPSDGLTCPASGDKGEEKPDGKKSEEKKTDEKTEGDNKSDDKQSDNTKTDGKKSGDKDSGAKQDSKDESSTK